MLERVYRSIHWLPLMAVALVLSTSAPAQDRLHFGAGVAARHSDPLDLELDQDPGIDSGGGSVDAGRSTALTFGPSRAVRGRAPVTRRAPLRFGASPQVLQFNLKGFSVLRMRGIDSGPEISVRRLRGKQQRRPLFSFTINKRF